LAEIKGCALDALTLTELREVDPRIEEEALAVLGVHHSVASRTSFGGTAPQQVLKAVTAAEARYLVA
jgi:argininosuccinate lyase